MLLGNIEIPFLDCYDDIDGCDYLILELSSYQVANMLYNVDYSVVLNLFPEHVDWHVSHDNYYRDKLRINNFSKNRIINYDNDILRHYVSDDCIYFNDDTGFRLDDNYICNGNRKLFNFYEINNIRGQHVFKNINSLFTIFSMENIDLNKAFDSMRTFKTLEHRLEIFYEDKERNIIFVNDSISTIPEAAIECLNTFKTYKNIKLVLGGFNRGQNYDKLVELINNNKNIEAFLLGSTGESLKERLNNCIFFEAFEELVIKMVKSIENDAAIILSPASASFDMFKNYKERGNLFKELVLKYA
jgi:UDP-N-acetylmuramoylalanine--D-glutamate ligase